MKKYNSVNDLEIIFNGTCLDDNTGQICKMKSSSNGFDSPIGNYILYGRTNYGSEKHSYIQFSADDDNVESMRSIFFEFAKSIGGKYEGTEYLSEGDIIQGIPVCHYRDNTSAHKI